jgi:O-antigen/teichoic acid export membrane protein
LVTKPKTTVGEQGAASGVEDLPDLHATDAEKKEALHSSVISQARKGTLWTVIAYASAQIVRFASSVILSRLFAPQLFGFMALLNTLIIGLTLFSDVGLGPSVIRSEQGDDPDYLNTVWTVQALRGLMLWIACAALTWPIAHFYQDDRLLTLTPIIGLSLILSGFNSTSILTFNRNMEVRKVALLELSVQLFQVAATVAVALINRSVWALVIGKLLADCMRLAVSHRMIPGYKNRFRLDKAVVKDLLSFGKWIFASTALTFLSSQSDRLVLGKLVSLTTLGLYGIAFALSDIPRQVIMAFRGYVGLPFVSKFSHLARAEFRAVIIRYRRLVLLAGALLLSFGVNFSDLFLLHIYDKRYHDAAWMVPILALGLWHTILYSTSMPCLTMLGKVSYNVVGYVFTAVSLLVVVPLVFPHWGLLGAVCVISFSDIPVYFCNLWGLWREKLLTLRQDIEMTGLFVILTAAFYFIRLQAGFPLTHPVLLR